MRLMRSRALMTKALMVRLASTSSTARHLICAWFCARIPRKSRAASFHPAASRKGRPPPGVQSELDQHWLSTKEGGEKAGMQIATGEILEPGNITTCRRLSSPWTKFGSRNVEEVNKVSHSACSTTKSISLLVRFRISRSARCVEHEGRC
ncbi:uncharacterized protein IWZ02DRAFT_455474 [Phyllosticta citriasiana]|uniref:uncharacterized protein n=1 Tax=Phyllosticta citriasiana TaxID=595635 RepID=UPI0030FD291C